MVLALFKREKNGKDDIKDITIIPGLNCNEFKSGCT